MTTSNWSKCFLEVLDEFAWSLWGLENESSGCSRLLWISGNAKMRWKRSWSIWSWLRSYRGFGNLQGNQRFANSSWALRKLPSKLLSHQVFLRYCTRSSRRAERLSHARSDRYVIDIKGEGTANIVFLQVKILFMLPITWRKNSATRETCWMKERN